MAKVLYCWRCQMEIPMLEEHEWEEILPLLNQRTQDKKQTVRARYKQITGFDEPNHLAIWHHRLSLYGPPCASCGKPLRTPRAKFCAECGSPRVLVSTQSQTRQSAIPSTTNYAVLHDNRQSRLSALLGVFGKNAKVSADIKLDSHPPIWPVLIAPLVAIGYYAALKSAFSISIFSALGEKATVDIVENIGIWGSHWLYRLVAEILSVGFGTFIAAGLARDHERAAATIGGFTITLGFILFWLAFLIFRSSYTSLLVMDITNYYPEPGSFADLIFIVTMIVAVGLINTNPAEEPWYQHAIGGFIVIAAPFIGIYVAGIARQLNVRHPIGLLGINRLHLIWLWLAAFCYALGLIEPVSRLLARPRGAGDLLTGIITGLPASAITVAALLIPGFYGLSLLSGHKGNNLHLATRNLLGVIVLIVGFLIVAAIQFGLLMALQKD